MLNHISELEIIESIKSSVEQRLTGSDECEVIDAEPGRRFSVGILNANQPNDQAQGSVFRKPESIGFFVRLQKPLQCKILKCNISFSLYYRIIPTLEEQTRAMSIPGDNEDVVPKPKYRRIDKVAIGSLTLPTEFSDRVSLDCNAINTSISDAISDVKKRVTDDQDKWPRPKIKICGKDLRSNKEYREAFARMGTMDLPSWAVSFSAELVDFSTHLRLLLLLTNKTDPNQFSVAWHCPEIFNARFHIVGVKGCFSPELFSPIRNDYRYNSYTYGKGINTVLYVDNNEGKASTEHLPIYRQPRLRSREGFSKDTSSEGLASKNAVAMLINIHTWLNEYAHKWSDNIDKGSYTDEVKKEMLQDNDQFLAEINRYEHGIRLIEQDEMLFKAFRFMNRTFHLSGVSNWYLFQVCFFVSMLPSLYAREHGDLPWAKEDNNIADVLWFPTGGGKTEAFLAVVVTALFYDRLRGKSIGPTAWLRYPLRMLSVQQLQRLIDVLVCAEDVRLSEQELVKFGDPFSIGYYVGEQNAPNELTFPGKGKDVIDSLYDECKKHPDGLKRYRVLSYCPKCKSESIKVDVDKDNIRIIHVCKECKFKPHLYISDSEIYRYLPSILVGTVDRLARAGQTDRFSTFFTGPTAVCKKHGYASFGTCIESKRCKERLTRLSDLKDPAPMLLIQDEIHLLRESLGTYDSHYEGLVDLLSRHYGSKIAPKRIAATATIEGLEYHLHHLYVRNGRCFPVKGMHLNDSAYVEIDPEAPPARLYVGVLPSGRDADDVSRVIGERICQGALSRHNDKSDNADFDFLLVYVNEKNTAGDIKADWPDDYSVQVLTGNNTLDEVRQVIGRVKADGAKQYTDRLHAVIATSVVSHGVDLSRINQMIIAGMPRSAAEYIQSSSRSGRSHVGIIFTVFRWQNKRNVSMYEHFIETHERLYQLVQPVPINRLSSSSIERTTTGLLAAVIYNLIGPEYYNSTKGRLNSAHEVMKAIKNKNIIESMIAEAVSEAYFYGYEIMSDYRQSLQDIIRRIVRNQLQLLSTKSEWSFHSRLDPKPVSSLREVGEQIDFGMSPRDMGTVRLLHSAWEGSKS